MVVSYSNTSVQQLYIPDGGCWLIWDNCNALPWVKQANTVRSECISIHLWTLSLWLPLVDMSHFVTCLPPGCLPGWEEVVQCRSLWESCSILWKSCGGVFPSLWGVPCTLWGIVWLWWLQLHGVQIRPFPIDDRQAYTNFLQDLYGLSPCDGCLRFLMSSSFLYRYSGAMTVNNSKCL